MSSEVVADSSVQSSVETHAVDQPEPAGSALLIRSEGDSSHDVERMRLAANSPLARLPLQLDVTVPIPSFRVQDLLALEKGSVLESDWSPAEDVPVWCGGVQLVWTEFEVVDQHLAVRVTRVG